MFEVYLLIEFSKVVRFVFKYDANKQFNCCAYKTIKVDLDIKKAFYDMNTQDVNHLAVSILNPTFFNYLNLLLQT